MKYFELIIIIAAIILLLALATPNLRNNGALTQNASTSNFLSSLPKSEISVKNSKNTNVNLSIWKATSDKQLQEGLMYVTSLPDYQGMLFIFQIPQSANFWMKDTLIPLDIIFINDSKQIVTIVHNATPCKTQICDIYPSKAVIKYVLEVNGGWTENNDVNIGNTINL